MHALLRVLDSVVICMWWSWLLGGRCFAQKRMYMNEKKNAAICFWTWCFWML